MTRREFMTRLSGCLLASIVSPHSARGMAWALESDKMPSRDRPLLVNPAAGSLIIYTEVNGQNLEKTNPHWGVVFKDGTLADRAILKAHVHHLDFHDALTDLGVMPGNNLTEKATGVHVGGDGLSVTATWPGAKKEYRLDEIFADSAGKGFRIRFGGNRPASQRENTGCITCLESCWVGVTSNATYPIISTFKRWVSPNSLFKGNGAVLPNRDGSPVFLIYRRA